ncbi:MAG: 4-hydroxythreonine-4-phosphate dehydrogenase 2 [Pseudomonadota bacterium]
MSLQVRDDCRMNHSLDSTSRPQVPSFRLGLTMGDPSGIGPEICLKALHSLHQEGSLHSHSLELFGDADHLHALSQSLGLPQTLLQSIAVRDTGAHGPYPTGNIHRGSGEAAARAIEAAAQDCLDGRLDAMVTAPIHKGALALTGRPYPGHTEFLAALSARPTPPSVRMMLVNPRLRVVLNSIHLPLRSAIESLNRRALLETIQITHRSLAPRLDQPLRIALAGLNPHASDGGLFGHEEAEILSPVVQEAQALGLPVSGPWPADSVFRLAWGERWADREFDVVICLYHDQGLIPIKLLGIEDGVNCTLGLPFIRTSVDHGTAFEIAGQNRAQSASMRAAIETAVTLCRGSA